MKGHAGVGGGLRAVGRHAATAKRIELTGHERSVLRSVDLEGKGRALGRRCGIHAVAVAGTGLLGVRALRFHRQRDEGQQYRDGPGFPKRGSAKQGGHSPC
jgi:hypothetical protein